MRVYHLLSAEWGLSNIALQRIKISRLNDLNDPFELQAVNVGGRKKFRKILQAWKRDLNETKGLLCFSKGWRNPVLWSHYAAKHYGMCLGFELADGLAKKVQYTAERVLAQTRNDGDLGVDESLIDTLLYTKYSHWAYEEEIRAWVDLDPTTIEGGHYFYPFSADLVLREVILGPLCEIPVARVRALVDKTYESVYVTRARLAFKFFKVVENEKYRTQQPSSSRM